MAVPKNAKGPKNKNRVSDKINPFSTIVSKALFITFGKTIIIQPIQLQTTENWC